MTTDNERRDFLHGLLTLSAAAVGDTLTTANVDSEGFAFTIVMWTVGKPKHCSSVCGSGHPDAQGESPIALAHASEKSKRTPSLITAHRSGKLQ